jgi:hypothetical protein
MEMVCADSKMEMALVAVQVVVVEAVPISAKSLVKSLVGFLPPVLLFLKKRKERSMAL